MSDGHGLVRLISQRRVVWIDAEAYGRRVLMAGAEFSWCNTASFVQGYGRLLGLVKSDVVALGLGSFFESWVTRHPTAISIGAPRGRIANPLTQLLGNPEARAQFVEIATAVGQSFKQVLALVLPPFDSWIKWAHERAHIQVGKVVVDEDAIDDIAVAAADFVRSASGAEVDTLLINESAQMRISLEQPDLYAPLTNLARHYHWDAGLRRDAVPTDGSSPDEFDYVVARGTTRNARFNSIELPIEFWSGGAVSSDAGLVYAQVPVDATPENVVARLGVLQRRDGPVAVS